MSPRGDAGDSTYRTVRDRYGAYREHNPRGESRSAIRFPTIGDEALRLLGTVVGIGTGLGLLVLAVVAFVAASRWNAVGQDGAAVAYTITGFFLTLAGIGGVVGTWNHNFRVVHAEPDHH
jgi:hypothetical protein